MTRKFAFFGMVIFLAAPLAAQKSGDLGVGFMVGDPTGLTGKYWLDKTRAVDMALGFEGDFSLHADYLWHSWDLWPQPRGKARLAARLGLGVLIHDTGKDNVVGLRFPLGADLDLHPHPLEVFAELAPVLRLAPDVEGNLDGALGVRFYFAGRRRG
jgi:hypothetical protein